MNADELGLAAAIAHAEQFARGGDILADMLGYAVAAVESGEEFTDTQLQAARDGIVIWHRMRSTSNGRT